MGEKKKTYYNHMKETTKALADLEISGDPSPDQLVKIITTYEENGFWSRCAFFDEEGTVIASTYETNAEEIKTLASTGFASYDSVVGNGYELAGHHFDVFKYFEKEGLAYGRYGKDPQKGEGICLHRIVREGKPTIYTVITFTFPMISTVAVKTLNNLTKKYFQ